MRPVPPPKDLPPNVRAALFRAPEGMEDEVNDIAGMVHLDPAGETAALEFMFRLSDEEIQTLKHEPYITLVLMTDQLAPFTLQTSFPANEKYQTLEDHAHVCTANLTHEDDTYWRCQNPTHDPKQQRKMECDECWDYRLNNPVVEDDPEVG